MIALNKVEHRGKGGLMKTMEGELIENIEC